jgi:Spy/CpxP family protein refolding chaperone
MADNRTRVWFSLFVLAVFVVGMAAGMMIGRRLEPPERPPRPPFGGRGPGPGGPPPRALIDRLDQELDLSREQRSSIQKIFEGRREPLERARREMRERMDREQGELQAEIRKVLTPEQQPKFDDWLERDRERGRGRGRGRGGPFGPPPR